LSGERYVRFLRLRFFFIFGGIRWHHGLGHRCLSNHVRRFGWSCWLLFDRWYFRRLRWFGHVCGNIDRNKHVQRRHD